LIRPTLELAIALNHAARQDDEWFDEPDDQSVFDRWPEAGRYQQGADFVAVQANGVGVVIQPRPPNVERWGNGDEAFFFVVAVEPGDGRSLRETVARTSPRSSRERA
jgi:hypothetical protein